MFPAREGLPLLDCAKVKGPPSCRAQQDHIPSGRNQARKSLSDLHSNGGPFVSARKERRGDGSSLKLGMGIGEGDGTCFSRPRGKSRMPTGSQKSGASQGKAQLGPLFAKDLSCGSG